MDKKGITTYVKKKNHTGIIWLFIVVPVVVINTMINYKVKNIRREQKKNFIFMCVVYLSKEKEKLVSQVMTSVIDTIINVLNGY